MTQILTSMEIIMVVIIGTGTNQKTVRNSRKKNLAPVTIIIVMPLIAIMTSSDNNSHRNGTNNSPTANNIRVNDIRGIIGVTIFVFNIKFGRIRSNNTILSHSVSNNTQGIIHHE